MCLGGRGSQRERRTSLTKVDTWKATAEEATRAPTMNWPKVEVCMIALEMGLAGSCVVNSIQ
jgi:hypothetical protein